MKDAEEEEWVFEGDEAIKHSSHTHTAGEREGWREERERERREAGRKREKRKEKEMERREQRKASKGGILDSRIRNSENLKSKFDIVVRKGWIKRH